MADFIAGPFTATLGGVALGVVEDGFELDLTWSSEDIRGDNLGDTIQDGVHRGGSLYVNCVLENAKLATSSLEAVWPYAATAGTQGEIGVIGSLYSVLAQILILTPIDAVNTLKGAGLVYTFGVAGPLGGVVPAPNVPISQLFAARLRKIPMRFLCLPYIVSSKNVWFVAA